MLWGEKEEIENSPRQSPVGNAVDRSGEGQVGKKKAPGEDLIQNPLCGKIQRIGEEWRPRKARGTMGAREEVGSYLKKSRFQKRRNRKNKRGGGEGDAQKKKKLRRKRDTIFNKTVWRRTGRAKQKKSQREDTIRNQGHHKQLRRSLSKICRQSPILLLEKNPNEGGKVASQKKEEERRTHSRKRGGKRGEAYPGDCCSGCSRRWGGGGPGEGKKKSEGGRSQTGGCMTRQTSGCGIPGKNAMEKRGWRIKERRPAVGKKSGDKGALKGTETFRYYRNRENDESTRGKNSRWGGESLKKATGFGRKNWESFQWPLN